MAILIDRPRWSWQGTRWSHLISDIDVGELHTFARKIRLRYLSYQGDHYDVPEALFERAIDSGAEVEDPRVLVRRLRDAGLRRRGGKSSIEWTALGEGSIASVGEFLEGSRHRQLSELAHTHGPTRSFTVLERPLEQVALMVLGDERVRLRNAVELLGVDCALVESDDPRGHTLEVVWRSGAGRELDHR